MRISFGLLKFLAPFSAAAEKAHDAYAHLMQKHQVQVSWANDGIGYLIAFQPKQETIVEQEEEIEYRFFNGPRNSFMPAAI